MERKLVYYAHCLAIYGTPQEDRDVDTLEDMGFDVINPNDPAVSMEWNEVKNDLPYLEAFAKVFLTMVEDCDIFAFRALPDGSIPGGVAMELGHAQEKGKPILELPSGISKRCLDKDQTREYLKEIGQR